MLDDFIGGPQAGRVRADFFSGRRERGAGGTRSVAFLKISTSLVWAEKMGVKDALNDHI